MSKKGTGPLSQSFWDRSGVPSHGAGSDLSRFSQRKQTRPLFPLYQSRLQMMKL